MEDISKAFLKKAKQRMKRADKTQTQLANEIGVCYSNVNKTFNNNRTLEFSLAVKIANNLDISIDQFIKLDYKKVENLDNIQDIVDEMDDLIKRLREYSIK